MSDVQEREREERKEGLNRQSWMKDKQPEAPKAQQLDLSFRLGLTVYEYTYIEAQLTHEARRSSHVVFIQFKVNLIGLVHLRHFVPVCAH